MAERKSPRTYWLRMIGWFIYLIALIIFYPYLLWTALPGIITNFSLAMGLMDL